MPKSYQGPAAGGTAAGAAARAAGFTPASEYEMEGAPAATQRSGRSGEQMMKERA